MAHGSMRCAFMRGGTSKGLMFLTSDLPDDPALRDAIFLAAMGSPDPYRRQLDGMGGGISSLSKICVVGPASLEGADVDYTFVQVAVDSASLDYSGNCGNMSAAIAPFAVLRGLAEVPQDGPARLRIHNTNTGKVIHAHFGMEDGRPTETGDFALDGVAGTASPIRLDFMSPSGAKTGTLLPTGNAMDRLALPDGSDIAASMVDATNPYVFVDGRDLDLNGTELPAEMERDTALKLRMEGIRQAASLRMGLADTDEAAAALIALPKIVALFPMRDAPTLSGRTIATAEADILSRAVSVGQVHNAIPLTGALCLASAMRVPGTIAATLAPGTADKASLTIAHPSGCISVDAERDGSSEKPSIARASAFRSARLLMDGAVHYRLPDDVT